LVSKHYYKREKILRKGARLANLNILPEGHIHARRDMIPFLGAIFIFYFFKDK